MPGFAVGGEPAGLGIGGLEAEPGDHICGVTEQRLHQVIRQSGPVVDRTLEITFRDPGVQVYSFTFG